MYGASRMQSGKLPSTVNHSPKSAGEENFSRYTSLAFAKPIIQLDRSYLLSRRLVGSRQSPDRAPLPRSRRCRPFWSSEQFTGTLIKKPLERINIYHGRFLSVEAASRTETSYSEEERVRGCFHFVGRK